MIVIAMETAIAVMLTIKKLATFTNHIKRKLIPDNQLVFF